VAVVGLAGYFAVTGLGGQPGPLPVGTSDSPTAPPPETEAPLETEAPPTEAPAPDNDYLLSEVADRLNDPDLVWTRTNTGTYEHPDWGWVPDMTRITTTADGTKLRMTESWDGIVHTDRLVTEADGQVTVLYLNMEDKFYSQPVSDRNFFVWGYGAVPPSVVTPTLLGALRELVQTGAEANLTGLPDNSDGRSLLQYSFEQSQLPALYQQASAQSASLWIDPDTKLPVRLDIPFDTLWPDGYTDDGLDRIRWELWPNTEPIDCSPKQLCPGEVTTCIVPTADCQEVEENMQCDPPGCHYQTTATFEWTTLAETTDFDLTVPADFTQLAPQEDGDVIELNLDEIELPDDLGDCWTIDVPVTTDSGEVVTVSLLCDALRQRLG